MMTEFCIVRHGESNDNSKGIIQGWKDHGLSPHGLRQAEAAAECLADETFDLAYCSDLGRAIQTAQAILKHHPGVPLTQTAELREWHLGELEGRLAMDCRETLKQFSFSPETFAPPGGETGQQFQTRILSFFRKTALENPGKKILVTTHGGAVRCVFALIASLPGGNRIVCPGNASVSVIRCNHETGGWELVSWNRQDHLKNVPDHPIDAF